MIWVQCFVGTLTWLCQQPHSQPKAAWSPWRSHCQRSHSARNPLELYIQRGKNMEIFIANWKYNWMIFPTTSSLFTLTNAVKGCAFFFPLRIFTLGSNHDGWLFKKEAYSAFFLPAPPWQTCPIYEVTVQLNLSTHHYQNCWLASHTAPQFSLPSQAAITLMWNLFSPDPQRKNTLDLFCRHLLLAAWC